MTASHAAQSSGGTSAKRRKMLSASGNGKGKGSAAAEDKEHLAPTSLPWSAVPLPLEASAKDGQSDADFFQGFSFDDDDFMGLTEVEGVEIVRGSDGVVRFVQDRKKGKAKGKAKQHDDATAPVKGSIPNGIKDAAQKHKKRDSSAVKKGDDVKNGQSSSTLETDELPKIDFASHDIEDDNDSASGGGDDDDDDDDTSMGQKDSDLDANFAILASKQDEEEDDDDEGTVERKAHKWTAKDVRNKMPAWKRLKLPLHSLLFESLHKLGFKAPTEIQAATLPMSIAAASIEQSNARDVVGVAQTGSGKTLAYGLPILHWIASLPPEDRQMNLLKGVQGDDDALVSRLAGLILTPTRELALQVSTHLSAIVDASSEKDRRWASIATVTGGMSEEKQRRVLQGYRGRGADVIVATPGRLWEMCKGDDALTRRIKTTRFLVVDEADRMMETGHFAELEHIFALVARMQQQDDVTQQTTRQATARVLGGANDMQTFIYSATLSKDLQHNLKRANRRRKRAKAGEVSTLDELLQAIDFRDDEPWMVDQSTLTGVAHNVVEVKAECLTKDKDLYLYYFLLRYPGRTLVFVNAIDGIRRLQPLLEQLQVVVQPLHSQLQQKQRLKSMDRFRATPPGKSAVLLATDVAARGLDIPAVDHVVHFQIPRTADTYVHRSGRTGRAGHSGVALALVDPTEKRLWRELCKGLGRIDDLPAMPLEYAFLTPLRQRIELAREIDKAVHTQKKASHDDAWLRKLAQDVELDLSADEEDADADKERSGGSGGKRKDKNVQAMRAQLGQLIKTPLRARGISAKYITSGSRDFLQTLLNDQQHDHIIGVKRSSAQSDVPQKSKATATAVQQRNGTAAKRKRA